MSIITSDNISNISPKDWYALLHEIDIDITKYYDEEEVIILSSPCSPQQMKSILTEILIETDNEFCVFCCDIIIDFLIFNKHYISNKMPQVTDIIYHQLLSDNALNIVHCQSGNIFSLPRDIHSHPQQLETDDDDEEDEDNDNNQFKVEFLNHPKYFDIIEECIYQKMTTKFAENSFRLIDADWSRKEEFYGIYRIGYRGNNDNKIFPADIILQKDDQLFVHFGNFSEAVGRKFGWVSLPNDRIHPPPKALKFHPSMGLLLGAIARNGARPININRMTLEMTRSRHSQSSR